MTEHPERTNPAEEIVKFWQSWMSAGVDAMQRTATLFAPVGASTEWITGLRDQIGKAVQAALEAARIPTAQDFQRFAQELGALRAQVEAMQAGVAALESLVKGQQAMGRALEGSVQQAAKTQEEMRRTIAAWSGQWEDRMAGVTRAVEEWRQRWEEMLRQGMTTSQASQKNLEDLTKSMWNLSQKVMGRQPERPGPRRRPGPSAAGRG